MEKQHLHIVLRQTQMYSIILIKGFEMIYVDETIENTVVAKQPPFRENFPLAKLPHPSVKTGLLLLLGLLLGLLLRKGAAPYLKFLMCYSMIKYFNILMRK